MSNILYICESGGFYCPGATVYPSLPCSSGYYCRYGAIAAAPSQGYQADICPIGHYCPEMTAEPVDCPIGTFTNQTGLRNSSDCTACTPGIEMKNEILLLFFLNNLINEVSLIE